MSKWEVSETDDQEWAQILDSEGNILAECPIPEMAHQICLMHNEGIGLLEEITKDVVIDHNGRPTTRPSFFAEKAQDLLKRMGVDCE